MKRIINNRRLTDEERQKYRRIREQIADELPELIARHHQRAELPRPCSEETPDARARN